MGIRTFSFFLVGPVVAAHIETSTAGAPGLRPRRESAPHAAALMNSLNTVNKRDVGASAGAEASVGAGARASRGTRIGIGGGAAPTGDAGAEASVDAGAKPSTGGRIGIGGGIAPSGDAGAEASVDAGAKPSTGGAIGIGRRR